MLYNSLHDPLGVIVDDVEQRAYATPSFSLSVARRSLYPHACLQIAGGLAQAAGVSRYGGWHGLPGRRPWAQASSRHGLTLPDSRSPASVDFAKRLSHCRSCSVSKRDVTGTLYSLQQRCMPLQMPRCVGTRCKGLLGGAAQFINSRSSCASSIHRSSGLQGTSDDGHRREFVHMYTSS